MPFVKIDTWFSGAYKKNVEMHNENVENNPFIISRFINATCYLAFCECDEQVTFINRGNYDEFISLTSVLDLKLSGRLSNFTVFSNLSGNIQIDLIQSISNILLKHINNKIKKTDYVFIIMDETTDIVSRS